MREKWKFVTHAGWFLALLLHSPLQMANATVIVRASLRMYGEQATENVQVVGSEQRPEIPDSGRGYTLMARGVLQRTKMHTGQTIEIIAPGTTIGPRTGKVSCVPMFEDSQNIPPFLWKNALVPPEALRGIVGPIEGTYRMHSLQGTEAPVDRLHAFMPRALELDTLSIPPKTPRRLQDKS